MQFKISFFLINKLHEQGYILHCIIFDSKFSQKPYANAFFKKKNVDVIYVTDEQIKLKKKLQFKNSKNSD